jgi:heterodisulfide reductase subunit A
MGDVGRHPNIKILTNTDIESVQGQAGNFEVRLIQRPRYVDEALCVACRACSSYCPVNRTNPFDEHLSTAKAIDVLCTQAIPAAAVVDRESCLYFQNKCSICVPVCGAKAIDLKQKRKRLLARVGAIIATTGYDVFDAKRLQPYGYGRMPNVLTSLEFERLLNADGPHNGEVLRPSDGKVPQKIAWLQCVGSRDPQAGHSYCSGICCTYAVKHVLLTKNHYPKAQLSVFHNDIRTFGKGFEEIYNRAQSLDGVRFIKKRVPTIMENPKNNNLILTYFSGTRTIADEYEMVVLSVGVSPGHGTTELARIMGLGLNEHGFLQTGPFTPNGSDPFGGIYPAGTLTGPMDIPDAISSSTGAVSLASQLLADQRDTLTQSKVFPAQRSVENEAPKIGVFVCHCGTNIAGVADMDVLVQHASSLDNVVHCENQLISCAPDSCRKISEIIKEKDLNRVVVAACTPRDHLQVFQETLRESGLNPYLLEMANIREQCSWVHSFEKEEATQKANDLISMAVAKANNLVPLKEIELPVTPRCLVLGGGLAGMQAALSLSKQGFKVYLVEKESVLGGKLNQLQSTLEGLQIDPFLKNLIAEVYAAVNIEVYTGFTIKAFSGYVGNFKSVLAPTLQVPADDFHSTAPVELEHGAVIVATGGNVLKPEEYGYGKNARILTQLELEQRLTTRFVFKDLRQVAMIQCVGARNQERPYCSRICCETALKNALRLKQLHQDMNIIIFYRDLRAYGFAEDYYTKARQAGISFVRYAPENAPRADVTDNDLRLSYYDPVLNLKADINPDLLVLSTPVIPDGNRELSQLLRIPLGADGFFMEAHMKLRPLDFSTDGMFLCGMAQYPKRISETIAQANGAAARVATILSKKTIVASGAVAEVNEADCISCGLCKETCRYGAIDLYQTDARQVARVIPASCKGCGVCAAICPTSAITHNYFTDHQILSQIDTAYKEWMR